MSADVAVPEHARELAFYASVLTTGDTPLWRDDLTNNRGTPIIGLGARSPEYESLPLQWMPHFQVADVGASVEKARQMGGSELMHGKDDTGLSQWAVLADPNGAAFGVVPVVPCESDASQDDEPIGCITWLSLRVPDASASRDFYQGVVGWSHRLINKGETQVAGFEMDTNVGTAAAEILQSQDRQERVPPVWLIHLPVGNLVESIQRAGEGGGEIVTNFDDSQYAVVRDPVGVYLALQAG